MPYIHLNEQSIDYGTAATRRAAAPPPLSVMVVDDQATAREILAAIVLSIDPLAEVHKFEYPVEAIAWAAANDVDLVLTDLRMPVMDGVEFIRRLRALPHCADIPAVVVTMLEERATRHAALDAGATDFLNKPLDKHEAVVRCRNLMTMRRQQKQLRDRAQHLQAQVELATVQLRDRELQTLFMLAKAGEFRDTDTGNHVIRVSRISGLIARQIDADEADVIETSALLHDIGKIGISDTILLKPGKLTPEEMAVMREHTRIGHLILSEGKTHFTAVGAEIAISHHERFDGSGYPNGLAGDSIPVTGRVVAVADTLDALVAARPYKKPWTLADAFAYIAGQAGASFDPRCVRAVLDRQTDVRQILESYR
jgi:two-component system response regulator RpfG